MNCKRLGKEFLMERKPSGAWLEDFAHRANTDRLVDRPVRIAHNGEISRRECLSSPEQKCRISNSLVRAVERPVARSYGRGNDWRDRGREKGWVDEGRDA